MQLLKKNIIRDITQVSKSLDRSCTRKHWARSGSELFISIRLKSSLASKELKRDKMVFIIFFISDVWY